MYCNRITNFLPVEYDYVLKRVQHAIRKGAFIRVYKEDNKILGWILATKTGMDFNQKTSLQQQYFCSNETGYKLYKILKLLHEELFIAAKECDYAISSGSPLDENMIFAKLLEKAGWTRHGYLCYRSTR
jgi:hypothetical protein